MAKELTPNDLKTRRLLSCVDRFPNAETGAMNQRCCRFPKACNPYATVEAYQAGNINETYLEPADHAPIRFEPADSPEANRPIPRNQTPVVTETKTLTTMRVGDTFRSTLTEEVDTAIELERNRRVHRLEAHVLQEKLADDYYEETLEIENPLTWWDMFKAQYRETWWGGWLSKVFGIKWFHENYPVRVHVERFVNYPESDIPIGRLGRPVTYERLRRMSVEEMHDQDDEKRAVEQHEEKQKEVVVYSLIPETISDLVNETGLDRNWFEMAYEYDQDFGFQSKIYIIPEGMGGN